MAGSVTLSLSLVVVAASSQVAGRVRVPRFRVQQSAAHSLPLRARIPAWAGRIRRQSETRSQAVKKPEQQFFERLEGAIYSLDSSRDEFISRLKARVIGEDPLSSLDRSSYFVQPGDWVVITGGTEGIGKATAEFLVRNGAKVTLIGRDSEKGNKVVAELARMTTGGNGAPTFVHADLGSFRSVQQAIASVLEESERTGLRIKCLINNAGIWPTSNQITEDGIESAFQVNHLSHFLITNDLLPVMAKPSRVVTTSSLAHAFTTEPDVEYNDLNWRRNTFDSNANYGRSKLANLHFARHLAMRLDQSTPSIKSLAIHPGLVATQLFREFPVPFDFGRPASLGSVDDDEEKEDEANAPLIGRARGSGNENPLETLVSTVLKTPEEGARTLIYAALAPQAMVMSGSYLVDCKARPVSAAGRNVKAAQRLWDVSEQLIQEKVRLGHILPGEGPPSEKAAAVAAAAASPPNDR